MIRNSEHIDPDFLHLGLAACTAVVDGRMLTSVCTQHNGVIL